MQYFVLSGRRTRLACLAFPSFKSEGGCAPVVDWLRWTELRGLQRDLVDPDARPLAFSGPGLAVARMPDYPALGPVAMREAGEAASLVAAAYFRHLGSF
jgi:hypothetical protein